MIDASMQNMNDHQFDALYLAIGRFMVNWGQIEYEMYRCTKMVYAKCAASILPKRFPNSIANQISLFTKALSKDPRLSDLTKDGHKLTGRIWQHRDLRNDLMHSSISGILNAATVTFMRAPERAPEETAIQKQVELKDIENQGKEIEAFCFDLGYFVPQFERALYK